jgi:hypothetical protein
MLFFGSLENFCFTGGVEVVVRMRGSNVVAISVDHKLVFCFGKELFAKEEYKNCQADSQMIS